MYGSQSTMFYTHSLLENALDLERNRIEFYWQFTGNESLITRGRNFLVDCFLKNTQCTHLMFIDADIKFPYNGIRKLLETEEDFVCAPYPKKTIDWKRIQAKLLENGSVKDDYRKYGSSYVINYLDTFNIPKPNKKGLIEVLHAGTGFMLLSRNVFTKLEPKMKKARASNFGYFNQWYTEFFKTDIDDDGVLQSEDWWFCNQWRDNGGKIWLKQDIELSHFGTYLHEGNIELFGANIT